MSENPGLHELLRWYVEAGVDETVGECPVDRYQAQVSPAAGRAATAVRPVVAESAAYAEPPAAVSAPQRRPQEAPTLEALHEALEAFDGCPLKRGATQMVFGDGNPHAPVMVVGEAPGAEEDRVGRPFVGASGQLLDRMLASIGLSRASNVYITNVVNWRPPGNRKPTPAEVEVCLPFIERHIELVGPEILILCGGAAASALLATHEPISRIRGRWFEYTAPGLTRPINVIATYHPAFLLRTPGQKREAWRDLRAIRQRLDQVAARSNGGPGNPT